MLGHVQAEKHHQAPQELAVARRRQLLEPAQTRAHGNFFTERPFLHHLDVIMIVRREL